MSPSLCLCAFQSVLTLSECLLCLFCCSFLGKISEVGFHLFLPRVERVSDWAKGFVPEGLELTGSPFVAWCLNHTTNWLLLKLTFAIIAEHLCDKILFCDPNDLSICPGIWVLLYRVLRIYIKLFYFVFFSLHYWFCFFFLIVYNMITKFHNFFADPKTRNTLCCTTEKIMTEKQIKTPHIKNPFLWLQLFSNHQMYNYLKLKKQKNSTEQPVTDTDAFAKGNCMMMKKAGFL